MGRIFDHLRIALADLFDQRGRRIWGKIAKVGSFNGVALAVNVSTLNLQSTYRVTDICSASLFPVS